MAKKDDNFYNDEKLNQIENSKLSESNRLEIIKSISQHAEDKIKRDISREFVPTWHKFFLGLFLLSFFLVCVMGIITLWPKSEIEFTKEFTFPVGKIDSNGIATKADTTLKAKTVWSSDVRFFFWRKDAAEFVDTSSNSQEVIFAQDTVNAQDTVVINVAKMVKTKKCKRKLMINWFNQYNPDNYRKIKLGSELRLLLLILFSGAFGSFIYIANSLANYIGSNKFRSSWTLFYVFKPLIGAGLAFVIFLVLKAGFLTHGSSVESLNLYGVLTFAALAGLYSDKTTKKIELIFEMVFNSNDGNDTRADKLIEEKIVDEIVEEEIVYQDFENIEEVVYSPDTVTWVMIDRDENTELPLKIEFEKVLEQTISGVYISDVEQQFTIKENNIEIPNAIIDVNIFDLSKTGKVSLEVIIKLEDGTTYTLPEKLSVILG